MTDKDRVCVCVCFMLSNRHLEPTDVLFWGKKDEGKKKKKHFQAVFWGGAHWHMFSPDLVRANCSRAVTGCEPALRAAVNESN